MVESGRVPKKDRFRASTEKLSICVPENGRIRVSIDKWWNPGEFPEKKDSVPVPKNCPYEYQKMVESVRVSTNGRIRASSRKKKIPCKYRKAVRASTEKGSNQCRYRKLVESGSIP